jgi:hypothetical protein
MKTLARARDKDEILRRMRALRPESAARWGRMSSHQMVCHLSDSCRMATGQKLVSQSSNVLQRTVVKWIALYAPMPWPPGILTRPELDQECSGSRPVAFGADIDVLQALMELMTDDATHLDGRAHPIFGRMSRRAWLRWGYLHFDHHLRQFGV